VTPPPHAQGVEGLALEDDLFRRLPGLGVAPQPVAHVHPADGPVRCANHQHHRIGLLLPIAGPTRIFDLEDLLSIALAEGQVRVAGLQLQIEPLSGGAACIVLEFDLAVDAMVAVRVAAVDLAGFS
jgi:hypothetical protein